jgi:hypothetical protein
MLHSSQAIASCIAPLHSFASWLQGNGQRNSVLTTCSVPRVHVAGGCDMMTFLLLWPDKML